jgi:hypothetical protein
MTWNVHTARTITEMMIRHSANRQTLLSMIPSPF